MKIIVNADDLGVGEHENDATFEFMRKGKVTSATLLANGSALDKALKQLPEFPNCSFGIHLNVTEFASLSKHRDLAPIVDANGVFQPNVREARLGKELRQAIFTEWCTQIEYLADSGVHLTHIDSHHHVHSIPELFIVLKRVQRRYGIRRVRLTKNLFGSGFPVSQTHLLKKALWNFALRHWFKTSTTALFSSFAEFIEIAQTDLPRCHSIELMVHPGNPDFADETALLAGSWENHCGDAVQLVSYRDI